MADVTKEKIANLLILLYLALFPFGQILRGVYAADIAVGLIAAYTVLTQGTKLLNPKGKFLTLLMLGCFSLIFSASLFGIFAVATGVWYFARLVCYVLLYFFIKKEFSTDEYRELLVKSLILINIVILIFGFIQYFLLPDLRFLKSLGWDDHYFRLVSTFLDPTFTGVILLVGLILSLAKKSYFLSFLNLIAIALTYSRSTYLALAASLVYFGLITRRKIILVFPILLLVSIPILPRPSSEGVKLERTYSIVQKFVDYRKGLDLFAKSPVFGIGFDNICAAKKVYYKEYDYFSHSCSGIDNSVILVLATTGFVGLIFLIEILMKVTWRSTFGVVLIAVLVHSLFANTLFYSFVMGFLAILLAIADDAELYSS